MLRGMIALEGTAKCFISLTAPDGLYWFLEDVPQHTFVLILPGAPMPKRSKTTREHIPARGNVGQRVGTMATGPGAITKIPYQALHGCSGTGRAEGDTALLAHLLAPAHEFQFFASGATEQRLLRVGQPAFKVNKSL